VSVSGKNKVVQRFKLNNILLEPNTVRLCTQFPATDHQFAVNIQEVVRDKDDQINREFLYEVVEKTLPMIVATDLNFEEPDKREKTYRKMPKLYIDAEVFPGKHKFRLSSCKSMLIDEYDDKFSVKLKCDLCKTYYWNIFQWRHMNIQGKVVKNYILYSDITSEDIICITCFDDIVKYLGLDYKFKETISAIFKLQFYCSHDCEKIRVPHWVLWIL